MAESSTPTTRLLLVEDDRKLVRALVRGLEREGYSVDAAHTGEEALL
jgi:ActR/RegA family two-component response regulator